MEIIIDKRSLLIEISKAIGATERKATMPILSNVLLRAKEGVLTIIATDLEVTIITNINCTIVKDGQVAVPAKKFYDYIRELPESNITIKKEDGFLEIKVGKMSGRLKVLQAEDFPKIEEYKNGFTKIRYDQLIKMIDKTIYATSVDEVKYSLNGVYIGKATGSLRCVATDSHRLSLYDCEEVDTIEGMNKGVIIPRKGLLEIKKIGGEIETEIAIEKNKNFIVKNGNTTIQVRLLDYDFPDYKSVIPAETKINIKIKKDILTSAVKRAQSIYQEKISRVVFNIEKDLLTIESNEPDIGEVREEIEVEYGGEPIKIGFNGRYLIESLSAMEGEFISIGLNNEQSASTFYADDNKKHFNLIMPMRM
ncbi:MAG: DNA polymerase III subunit beta [Deltaproteobacteria bacterium]|nr:DNA polymerase III subunit beta [Deltaproteobacteria bacterium]